MEPMREHEAEVLARRAMAEAREGKRVGEAGAPSRRKKFRGVRYSQSGNYGAEITLPGEKTKTWLGTYDDEDVAACAYDLANRSVRGPNAKTNFAYPPPDDLIAAVANAPGRRGPVYPVLPTTAPAPAAAPPTAPAPVPFEYDPNFSFKAPPSEPPLFPTFPFLQDTRPARARIGLAPKPEAEITLVRSIPPERFSILAAVAASRVASDPVDLFGPRIHIVASATETCFSTTDPQPQLRSSASSSRRMGSNSRELMLKTPKIFAVPNTTPTPSTSGEGFTGDNLDDFKVPTDFTLPPSLPRSSLMPLDVSSL